jgi:hypothetical protein
VANFYSECRVGVPFLASIPTIQLVWSQIQTRKIVVVSLKGKKKFSSSKRITNAKDRKHEEKTQKSKQSEFQTDSSERVSELQKCGVAWLVLFPIDPIKIFNHLDLIFQDFSPLVPIYHLIIYLSLISLLHSFCLLYCFTETPSLCCCAEWWKFVVQCGGS